MQANALLITTVIPTYRRPQLLRRAIQSVLSQTYPHLQVLVLDNASGDETEMVVAELAQQDPRVRYHRHPENIGAKANFLYGIESIDTPFFSFLSDDDVLLPNFYQLGMAQLTSFPDALFFAGTVIQITETGEVKGAPLGVWERDGYYPPPEGFFAMVQRSHLIMTGILFRKELLTEVGGLDPELMVQDSDLLLRTAIRHPFAISREPCAVFMMHSGSVSGQSLLAFLGYDWPRIAAKLRNDERVPPDVRASADKVLRTQLADQTYRIGVKSVVARQFADARTAASILRDHYRHPREARALMRLERTCRLFPPAGWGLTLAYKVLHLRHARSDHSLQRDYGKYAKYLTTV